MKKIIVRRVGLAAWVLTREVDGQMIGQEEWYSCWANTEARINLLKLRDWRYKVERIDK